MRTNKSGMRFALGLEELDIPLDDSIKPTDEDSSVELDILKDDAEAISLIEDNQLVIGTIETLECYADEIKDLITNKTCTPQTAKLLRIAVNKQLNIFNTELPAISLESGQIDIVQEHQLILEGIWENINQSFILDWKHFFDIVGDFFKSHLSMMKKYERIVTNAKNEYNSKKGSWHNSKHEGNLTELWYHFSTTKGQCKDIIADIKDDLKLSEYILTDYSKEVLVLAGKLTSVLKSGDVSSVDNILKLVKKVETLPHPVSLFKQSFISGKSYLSVTSLEVDTDTKRTTLTIGSYQCTKLATLASKEVVMESGNVGHSAKKVMTQAGKLITSSAGIPGVMASYAVQSIVSNDLSLSTAEIGTIIDLGSAYLDNAKKYMVLDAMFSKECTELNAAIKKLSETTSDDETKAISKKVLQQISSYATNILFVNFAKPAHDELARTIKGSKYCAYLGLRMISNAK